jgi:hypothetical protein
VETSRVLRAVQQITEERSFERVLTAAQERRQQRRSATMKSSWAKRRQEQSDAADEFGQIGNIDEPNARAYARVIGC